MCRFPGEAEPLMGGANSSKKQPVWLYLPPGSELSPCPGMPPLSQTLCCPGIPGCDCPRVWGWGWERHRQSPCPEPGCSPCQGARGSSALPPGSPGSHPTLHPAPGRAASLGSFTANGICRLPACPSPLPCHPQKASPGSHHVAGSSARGSSTAGALPAGFPDLLLNDL